MAKRRKYPAELKAKVAIEGTSGILGGLEFENSLPHSWFWSGFWEQPSAPSHHGCWDCCGGFREAFRPLSDTLLGIHDPRW